MKDDISATSKISLRQNDKTIVIAAYSCLTNHPKFGTQVGRVLTQKESSSGFLLSKDATLRALLVLYENIDITTDCYFLR